MIYLGVEALVLLADLAVGGKRRSVTTACCRLRCPAGLWLWGLRGLSDSVRQGGRPLHSLVGNHALIDGNKRLGWTAAVVFCDINGTWIEAPDDAA